MMPSIGRIVIVPMDPEHNNGSDEAPAIITRVWNYALVNVRVMTDGPSIPEWRTSVTLFVNEDEARSGNGNHVAWWPARVS